MKSFVKWLIWLIIIVLIIAGLIFASIPMILSSRSGTKFLLKRLQTHYGGQYEVQSLSLTWFRDQKVTDLKIKQGGETITIHKARLDLPLYRLYHFRQNLLPMIFAGELEITGGEFYLDDHTSLTNIHFLAHKDNQSLHLTGETTTQKGTRGNFSINGSKKDPWEWEGKLNAFPTKFIEWLNAEFPAIALLGPTLNSQFTYQKQLLNLKAQTPNLKLQTEGKLTKEQFFFTKPAKIFYWLTPQASDVLFKKSSIKPISAKNIVVTIQPEKSHFHHSPFTFDSLTISSMNIDLGQMLFRNFGTLSTLLSIIELRLRLNDDVPIWFQSMPITVKDGIADISRSDMLIDRNYEIGLWGKVDLPQQHVDANICLTAPVLRRVFDIKSIPDDFCITMPTNGPIDDVRIHRSRALRKIGQIVIAERAKLPVIPIPANEAPPNTRPLPWHRGK